MGVDRTDYLMFATEIPTEGFDWEKHEPEVAGMPNRRFDIIYDCMSGQYCLAGKVIAKSDPYEGFEMAKVNVGAVLEANELAEKVSDAFGRKLTPADFSLILFSHFH
jgi:hypothetical protein